MRHYKLSKSELRNTAYIQKSAIAVLSNLRSRVSLSSFSDFERTQLQKLAAGISQLFIGKTANLRSYFEAMSMLEGTSQEVSEVYEESLKAVIGAQIRAGKMATMMPKLTSSCLTDRQMAIVSEYLKANHPNNHFVW